MMDQAGRPLNVAETSGDGHLQPDDASDITPTDTRNVKKNNQAVIEKTVKFRFLPMDRSDDPIHPSLIHSQWIHAVQDAIGEDILLYDNHGRVVPKIDPLRWNKQEYHLKSFNLQSQYDRKPNEYSESSRNTTGRERSAFIVHRIRTSLSLRDIKRIPAVSQLLREHKVYLTEHRWSETVWNTTQLGFVIGLDPQFYDPEQAMSRVTQDLLKNVTGKSKIPLFRMAFCSPSMTTKDGRNLRTKAYAIETEKSSSMELLRIVKLAYKDNGKFVPFQMRSKFPDIFAKAISMQTTVLASHRTIVMNNIGTDAMLYLSHWIEQLEGVQDIVPYKTVETDGKFRVLVNKQEFRRTRSLLQSELPTWYENHVAPDAQPQRGRFPGAPAVATINSDDY
jgi:hypothetical protein